jgi:hypothetical protein
MRWERFLHTLHWPTVRVGQEGAELEELAALVEFAETAGSAASEEAGWLPLEGRGVERQGIGNREQGTERQGPRERGTKGPRDRGTKGTRERGARGAGGRRSEVAGDCPFPLFAGSARRSERERVAG